MAKDINSIKDLQEEVQEGQKVNGINVLFLDVSSSCVGYSIIYLDFLTKSSRLTKAGCLWFDSSWDHAEKYSYLYHALVNWFWIVEQVDYIVAEQYTINPNKMMGGMVVPEMFGVLKVAAHENGIKVASILPQSWRSLLGIKADVTINAKGKKERDFKDPAKRYVDGLMSVPAQVTSNITKNSRQTPSDLYDAICIGLAWVKKIGFNNTSVTNVAINNHIL